MSNSINRPLSLSKNLTSSKSAAHKSVGVVTTHTLVPNGETPCCPPVKASVWNSHPRVFLRFDDKGQAQCPYCGALFRSVGSKAAHH